MSAPWVCLMYHDVLPGGAGRSGGAAWFAVSLQGFARQLDQLQREGLVACSLESFLAAPSAQRIPMTFDDGTSSQYDHAFPALVERGMSATFFAVTRRIGSPGYATWDQLRAMRDAGMSIQSHTRSHPFLSTLDAAALRDELAGAREDLDRELGQRTMSLALPGGDPPSRALRHLIGASGYQVVATSRWGVNGTAAPGSPRFVRRCTIRGEPDAGRFGRIVHGDPLLGFSTRAREALLRWTRSALGPTRYARWRRGVLDTLGGR